MEEARKPTGVRMEASQLQAALKRLREIDRSTKRTEVREAWQLVQAICSYLHPSLQLELDAVRGEIMKYMQLGKEGQAVSMPRKLRPHRETWRSVQITPDLHHDHSLEGKRIPDIYLRKLKKGIRAQLHVLESHLYGGR